MKQRLAILAAFALLATRAPSLAAEAVGAAVYAKWCSHCHDPGISHPGTQALKAKYGEAWQGDLKAWPGLQAEYVRLMVRRGISVMPQFRKTEISDAELRALADYLTQRP